MSIERFGPEGPFVMIPTMHGDSRGYFYESFHAERFNDAAGRTVDFVQDNQSLSGAKHTVRGLHYQAPPRPQAKLVRCVQGAVVNIIVDARRDSPTFGDHIRVELTEDNHKQLFVPEGFLNGFATHSDRALMLYKVTDYFVADCDGSVGWNSPSLGLDWGIDIDRVTLSDKDAAAPTFRDWTSPF